MIEIIYTGSEPIIIEGVEFRYKKVIKVNQKQLNILESHPYFKNKIGSLFKVIGEPKIISEKDDNKDEDKAKKEGEQPPKEEDDKIADNIDDDQVNVINGIEIITDQTKNEIEEGQEEVKEEEVKPATNKKRTRQNANTKKQNKS